MITLELPPKVQIDKHIPSGYVIRGYTEKEMLSYALEFSLEYNKQLTQRIVELESNHKPALTQNEIIDGFCKTPDIRQHVSAFKAGVEYAESYHGIKECE